MVARNDEEREEPQQPAQPTPQPAGVRPDAKALARLICAVAEFPAGNVADSCESEILWRDGQMVEIRATIVRKYKT
jgi:hypothetical protein